MANYYPIPLEEMDEVLRGYRFAPVDLTYRNRPVKEWVYERRLPQSPNHFVRVYTGVQRYGRYAGRSRKVGKDAIRVQVVYRDEKGETLVSQPKRVHRVEGWRENLQKRMNEISSTLPQVEFDTRGEPMTLRKYQGNYFWGSRDYPKYKETKRFASEETVDAESFSAAEDIMNYLDTIWNEHSREIKEYVKNQMAGGGMNRDFDNDSMLNYTEDEWFDYKWELFRKSFEEGAWLTDGYVQAIRLLYVPVGTQIRLDELGNWKNRKADKYGVDGKEITSWIWETIKLQEFYGGGIFGDGDIDHTEGEEGIDFDRIVLNGFFKITDIDWLSTIAFNISSWNQEKELCVINGKPIIDGEIMRNDGSGKDITGFSAESGDDEWGGLPIHEINSLKELIDIFESRDYYDGGNLKRKGKAYTNYELMTNSLFKINFSGIYGVRTISGPSKVIYGVNLLQSNKVNKGSQLGASTILQQTYPDADVVSVECPFIPISNLPHSRSKESKLEDLIEIMKKHGGLYTAMTGRDKNTMIFDMRDVVFAADLPAAGWDIMSAGIGKDELKLLKKRGWRALHFAPKKTQLSGEIEILGGIPQENIVYEEIPPVALNPLEVDIETRNSGLYRTGRMEDVVGGGERWTPNRFGKLPDLDWKKWQNMTDEEYVAHWNQFASEGPDDEIDVDWEEEEEPEPEWEDIDWDAESYLERDKRLWEEGRWHRKMGKHEFSNVKPKVRRYNSIDELYAHKQRKHWAERAAEVSVLNFDFYVKRTMANPIATLYNRIIPLGNIASGYSDNFRERNNYLIKRYGAPLYASALWMPFPDDNKHLSPINKPTKKGLMKAFKMGRKWDENKIVRETGSYFIGIHTPSALISGGKRTGSYDEERDVKNETALLINLKGLKVTDVRSHGDRIKIWGGIPLSSIEGHWGEEPRFVSLRGEQHWIEQFDAEDEEITLKEFDDTDVGPNRMFKNMDDKITFMLRKTSKINRYGDIGCPGCGSIGLFYSEPISKGRKWHCLSCLYEDKIESIKSRGDITLEKYGLLIECPLCEKQIKAYNQDSVNRHMKKCKEESS